MGDVKLAGTVGSDKHSSMGHAWRNGALVILITPDLQMG